MTTGGDTRAGRDWVRFAPLFPVVLVVVGSLGFALAQSSALERDMRVAATQNMLWVVTQTQMELLQLTLAAGRAAPDADDVARRYDLALARLNLMRQGPQARYLDDLGHLDRVLDMAAALEALDPLEHDAPAALHTALFDLGQRQSAQINRIANDVMTHDWDKTATRLDDYRATQRVIIAAVSFALLAALAMSWVLLRNQKRLHAAQIGRLRAATELQQERNASAMYRDFAAIVSHQMRTPLSLIDSAMQRLARKGSQVSAADVAERRAVVGDAVDRLTRLVDTVMLLAKLDTDQVKARFEPLDMAAAARSLCIEIAARHPDRCLRLTPPQGARPIARGDPHLVGHILQNLIDNALKYAPPDAPVTLRVFAERDEVACAVADCGPGIDPADLPHLFERYYRGASTCTGNGTGLGLALARELAVLQGGRIEVDSHPGAGARFTLWLPRASGEGARDG